MYVADTISQTYDKKITGR